MRPAWQRSSRVALALVALTWCATTTLDAQKWTPGRTPDGQPDIQGIWINFDSTPFETPVAAPTQAAGSSAATASARRRSSPITLTRSVRGGRPWSSIRLTDACP